MIVVSNTSPIINLASIGQLDILRRLYQKVAIPEAVFHEIVVKGEGGPGAREVRDFDWIETVQATNQTLIASLLLQLDPGEAEAIALAVELKVELLLMDEQLGRRAAADLGLKFIGLLGVLIEAKKTGLISKVKPILDQLRAQAGFWIKEDLYNLVLDTAGE